MKLHAAQRMHAIADGNDDIEVIAVCFVRFSANFSNVRMFCTHCFSIDFPLLNRVVNMAIDYRTIFTKQLRHLRL